jgi:ribosomal protein L11 methyltransferase
VVRADDVVADVGCGSGVLAVAAARLGAAAVRAVDVEPEAVRATVANATRNGVAERVEASTAPATALSPDAHTVVVANIEVGVLEQLAPALALAAAPGATLVLGGLLADQVPRVRAAVEGVGLVATDERAEGEWRTLVARRP